MKNQKIITHPGSAHFDEFFAISLILAVHDGQEFEIFRKDPENSDLLDPEIWVVDIGGQHNTALKNFDHHMDLDTPASFVIVADYLNLRTELEIFEWFNYKDKIDRFGPFKVGMEMGTKGLPMTFSPFEEWYVDVFSKEPNACIPIMRAFGKKMVEDARALYSGIQFWKNADTYHVKTKTIRVGYTSDSTGAEEYCASLETPFHISICYDKRGEGWTLKRYLDDPQVDFHKIAGHEEIKFAHSGGFIAKTKKRIPLEDVLGLVALAIDDKSEKKN